MSYEYDFDLSKHYDRYQNTVHDNVYCDQCGVRPMRNLRFKCSVCDSYDLCLHCFLSGHDTNRQHSRSHPMHVITRTFTGGQSGLYETIGLAKSDDVMSYH